MRQSVLVSVRANEECERRKATTMERPVSDSLMELLDRQGMRTKTVGAVEPAMMRWANDLLDREEEIVEDHSPSGGGRPIRKPRVRIVRAMPFLAVIECGR